MVNVADYVKENKMLYAGEVRDFLSSFSSDDSNEQLNAVFSIVHDEWTKNGFVSLQALRKRICHDLVSSEKGASVNNAKKKLVDNLIDGAVNKDKLTGFYSKTECPLVTGLSDLYRRTTGDKVYRIDGDFSNMGGTNEFFRKELEAKGWGRREGDGFEYTDKLVSISSRIIFDTISKAVLEHNKQGERPKAHLHAFRSGGDEIRFIVTAIDNEQANEFIEKCDNEMKKFVKDNHLATHDNPKDSRRPGFGCEIALVPLNDNSISSGAEADRIISIKKLMTSIGNLYQKAAESDAVKAKECLASVAKIEGELNKAVKKDLTERGYSEDEIAKAINEMEKVSQIKQKKALINTNTPPKKGDVLALVENLDNHPEYKVIAKLEPVKSGTPLPIHHNENDFFADINDIRCRSVQSWANKLLIKNPNDLRIINTLTNSYNSMDSSTGLKMAGNLYDVMNRDKDSTKDYDIDRFVADVKKLQTKNGLDTNVQVKATHIEFANLAGVNNISHDHGDALLKDYADIIKRALKQNGVEPTSAVYSEGGGKFKIVLPECFEAKTADGKSQIKHIDDEFVSSLSKDIVKMTKEEINNKSIVDYSKEKGLSTDFSGVVDKNVKAILENPDAKIADIPNPKRNTEYGISVHTGLCNINDKTNTTEQLNNFTNNFETSLRLDREAKAENAIRAYASESKKMAKKINDMTVSAKTPKMYDIYKNLGGFNK